MRNLILRVGVLGLALAGLISHGLASGQEKKAPEGKIVKAIKKVDLKIQESDPPNLVVVATGEVSTGGYSNVKLTPVVYVKPPDDGIQDYTLTAVPPDGISIQVISQVTAEHVTKGYTRTMPWLKGVRIHGEGTGVMVKMLAK